MVPQPSRTDREAPGKRNPAAHVAGADVGTTLLKLVLSDGNGELRRHLYPRDELFVAAEEIRASTCPRVGITGSGASALAEQLAPVASCEIVRTDEFRAWGRGARHLLRGEDRFLLVSLGTGTSVILVEGDEVRRIGGTALGGGAILGLGQAVAGVNRFEEIVALAGAGDRRIVDLFISEIGDVTLPDAFIASSFGKLAREGAGSRAGPGDLLQAAIGLVAENVAWICAALASVHDTEHIVYCGSPLRDHPPFVALLAGVTRVGGHTPVFPENGEFSGAVGAMLLAGEHSASVQ